jgi:hypothetical protein
MGNCQIDGKECDCIVPCALPEMRLIWAHENDDTLDEWGIFLRGECIAKYEGENQTRMALEDMLRNLGQTPATK